MLSSLNYIDLFELEARIKFFSIGESFLHCVVLRSINTQPLGSTSRHLATGTFISILSNLDPQEPSGKSVALFRGFWELVHLLRDDSRHPGTGSSIFEMPNLLGDN